MAITWAREQGYSCCGLEVRVANCGYRADVAAYRPASEMASIVFEGKTMRRRQAAIGTTALFECKQSRADLIKDSCLSVATIKRLKEQHARRTTLERLLKIHYPSAANGESLFPEYDTYNFAATGHNGYAKVSREIATLQSRLFSKNKLEKLARYGCANLFYLVVTANIIANYELPLGWGLLVRNGESLVLAQRPVWNEVSPASRLAILHRIATTKMRG